MVENNRARGVHFSGANSASHSVPAISKTLAINEIPMRLLNRMKESPFTSSQRGAYELSRIFITDEAKKDPEKVELIADEIIDEAIKKSLTGDAIKALIEARMAGPKRATALRSVKFGSAIPRAN